MGAMQRRKGKAFERTVANLFKEVFPGAKRTLTQQRDSGEAPDIEAPGWWVEAKAHKRVNIQKAFAQAVDEVARAKSSLVPVAVTKDNGGEIMATLRVADFLRLLAEKEEVLKKNSVLVMQYNVLTKENRELRIADDIGRDGPFGLGPLKP